jgi:magnesium-transporting ATPase (P-type)
MSGQETKQIVDKIIETKMQMHSRQYFLFQTVGKIVLTVLSILLSIYIVSFVLYYLNISGAIHLTRFGFSGLLDLLRSLPLLIVILALVSLSVVVVISTSYKLSYRNPLIYSFIIAVATVIVLSMIVAQTPFHSSVGSLLKQSDGLKFLPVELLEPRLAPLHHSLVGFVEKVEPNYIILRTETGRFVKVFLPNELSKKLENKLEIGDKVLIRSDDEGENIDADDFYVLPR